MKNTNSTSNNYEPDDDDLDYGPSKSQVKRDCQNLIDLGEEILKLKKEEIQSLELSDELQAAVNTALKIKSRSGLKRQRQYIGKLLRLMEIDDIQSKVRKIQHRHDTNTAQFKRLEKWRDNLINNDKETLNDIISRHPEVDRQQINQLIRAAHKEKQNEKPPAAARKLFKYLSDLEEEIN